jgi:hypothetical protein
MTARLREDIADLSAGLECDSNIFRPVARGMNKKAEVKLSL